MPKVLVVSGDDMVGSAVAELIPRLVTDVPVAAVYAEDGWHALQLFQKALYTADPFTALLTDYRLSFKMNGASLTTRVIAVAPFTKVAMVIDHWYFEQFSVRAVDQCCFVLERPFTIGILSQCLEALIR